MKINDETVRLATVCFSGSSYRSVWDRARGSAVWTKDGTGATKSSARIADALRYFADQDRYTLTIDSPAGIAWVTEREDYVAPPMVKGPGFAYRCAGCGDAVIRQRRAKEGEPVWCGGRRCKKTFTIRLGNSGDTEQDIGRLFRLLPGVEAPVLAISQQ